VDSVENMAKLVLPKGMLSTNAHDIVYLERVKKSPVFATFMG